MDSCLAVSGENALEVFAAADPEKEFSFNVSYFLLWMFRGFRLARWQELGRRGIPVITVR
jgi:hypothetical protein